MLNGWMKNTGDEVMQKDSKLLANAFEAYGKQSGEKYEGKSLKLHEKVVHQLENENP